METKKDGRIQFRIEDDVPAGEQMEGFKKWLKDNKPSQVSGFDMSSDTKSDYQLEPEKNIHIFRCPDRTDAVKEKQRAAKEEWKSLPEDDKTLETVRLLPSMK